MCPGGPVWSTKRAALAGIRPGCGVHLCEKHGGWHVATERRIWRLIENVPPHPRHLPDRNTP